MFLNMADGRGVDSQLEQALAGGKPHPTGWFRLFFDDERWEWSPEVERLHGYEPGTAHPTTNMVLSHKHPQDYEQVAATLDDIRRTHKPFSTRHRIIDVQGRTHEVIVVAELIRGEGGEVIGTTGFYVDVTFPPEKREMFITEAVAEIAENRAVIEQVKGILMMVYRIDADAAFDLLRWRSQEANIKLRAIAEQLLADFKELDYDDTLPPRSMFDQLLLTVHSRVTYTTNS
jgi:PAS domain S-box-containing protein